MSRAEQDGTPEPSRKHGRWTGNTGRFSSSLRRFFCWCTQQVRGAQPRRKQFLSLPTFMGSHCSPLHSRPRGRMQKPTTAVAEPLACIPEREKLPQPLFLSPLFHMAGIVYDACLYFIMCLPCLSMRPIPLSCTWWKRRGRDVSTQVVGPTLATKVLFLHVRFFFFSPFDTYRILSFHLLLNSMQNWFLD